jgi:hypothetical protein
MGLVKTGPFLLITPTIFSRAFLQSVLAILRAVHP